MISSDTFYSYHSGKNNNTHSIQYSKLFCNIKVNSWLIHGYIKILKEHLQFIADYAIMQIILINEENYVDNKLWKEKYMGFLDVRITSVNT